MARYPSGVGYSFGPGGITPAVKILIITNVVVFVLNMIVGDAMTISLGLSPQAVFEQFAVWQPLTYMFLHSTGGFGHILFNMLALWMIGTELERTWGTRFFIEVLLRHRHRRRRPRACCCRSFSDDIYYTTTVGASGAIYGLLLAYAMYFPHRDADPVHLPGAGPHRRHDPRRDRFLSSMGGPGGGVAHYGAPRRTPRRLPVSEGPARAGRWTN